MASDEIKVKELEIKLEQLRAKRMDKMHLNRMEQLQIRKEIAQLYHPKKKKGGKNGKDNRN